MRVRRVMRRVFRPYRTGREDALRELDSILDAAVRMSAVSGISTMDAMDAIARAVEWGAK